MSQPSATSGTSRPSPVAECLEQRNEDESNYNYGWTHARRIAYGKYGKIYHMRRNLRPDRRGGGEAKNMHNYVAVKTLKLSGENEIPEHVRGETTALTILRDNPQNDRLIELLDWFLSDSKKLKGRHFCLVFPYIQYDLYDIVSRIKERKEAPWSEKRVKNLARQTLEGIEYLHGLCLVHRDIKPDNILVNTEEDIIKITDFGYTERLSAGVKTRKVDRWAGTPEYCSPEQWKHILGYCCDIWSFGVTLLELCNMGIPPWEMEDYEGTSDSEMDEEKKEKLHAEKRRVRKILEDEIINNEPYWNSEVWKEFPKGGTQHGVRPYSTAAKEFIMKLLEKDHEKRLTATEALKSDWLNARDDRPRERPSPTGEGSEHNGKEKRAAPAAGTTEKRHGSYERRRSTDVGTERNGKTKRTASTASTAGQLTEQMIGCSISSTNSPSSHDKINLEQTQSEKPKQKTKHVEKSKKGTKLERQALVQNNNRHNEGSDQRPKQGKHRVTRK